jgi:hypothetical protein
VTENGAESGQMHNMKVIENFGTFPKRENTPSYDQRFMSYDHCKLGGVAGNSWFLDRAGISTNLDFKPTSNGELEEP